MPKQINLNPGGIPPSRAQLDSNRPMNPIALGIMIGTTTIIVGLILAIIVGALALAATEIWQQVSLNI